MSNFRRRMACSGSRGIPCPPNGVYIMSVDGEFKTESEWVGNADNAVGIALLTDTKKMLLSLDFNTRTQWGGYEQVVPNLPQINNEADAKADMDGSSNTDLLIADTVTTDGHPAAEYCRSYTWKANPNNIIGQGYLPALGELNLMYTNKSAIDACLNKLGITPSTNCFWSSTQRSSFNSSGLRWSRGSYGSYLKDSSFYVWVVSALNFE